MAAASSLGLSLSPEQVSTFEEYEERLYSANLAKNLTRVPREEAWYRHFIDSLLFQDLIAPNSTVLDIGTGPGLPAWPLACARPDLLVTALDSNGKMIAFLQSVPLPNLQTVMGRAEELQSREVFDVVTGRAVAPLAEQVEISAPQCRLGGLVLPMRTARDKALNPLAVRELGLVLRAVHLRTLPIAEAVRVFPEFEKVSVTPYKYPRSWKLITRRPLGETFDPLVDADVQPR